MRLFCDSSDSIRNKWKRSYLFISAGLLFFMLILYAYMDTVIGRQIRHYNEIRANTIRNRISREIDWVEEIGFRISRDSRLIEGIESRGDIRSLITDFKLYLNMSSWIESMAFCQKRYDRVISTEGLNRQEDYSALMAETYKLKSTFDLNTVDLSSPVLYLSGTEEPPFQRPVILYSCRSNIRYPFPEDFILFHLDRDSMNEYLDSLSGNSRLTIYNREGERLIESGSPFTGKGRWITHSQEIDSIGWLIEIATPYRVFYSEINKIRRAAVLTLILMLLVHTLLTRHLTRKQYKPIRSLLNALTEEEPRRGNEYERLGSAIRSMNQTLASYREEIRDHMLCSFLRGEMELEEPQLKELIPQTEKGAFCIPFLLELETAGSRSPDIAVKIKIRNDLKELADIRTCTGVAGAVCGIAVTADESRSAVKTCLNGFRERWDFPVRLILGKSVSSRKELPGAFRDCLRYQYHITEGIGDGMIDLERERNVPVLFSFPDTLESSLLSAIRSGDGKRACRIVEDLIEENIRQHHLPGPLQDLFLTTLFTTVIKPLMNNLSSERAEIPEILNVTEDFNLSKNPSEKIRILESVVTGICTSFEKRKNSHNCELNRKLNLYLEENALNPAICLTMIADRFNMNQQYISRFYLEQNGHSINQKISDIRMEKAYELLKQGRQIKEVARGSGFNSTISFIRVFKKIEGVPPGRFRQEIS